MSDTGDELRRMADEAMGFLLGAAEDVDKGQHGWAEVALDEAAEVIGKMQQVVEEANDE